MGVSRGDFNPPHRVAGPSSPLRTKAPQILVFCCKKRCNRSLKKKMVLRPAYLFFRRNDFFGCVSTCLSSRECIFNPKNPFGERDG